MSTEAMKQLPFNIDIAIQHDGWNEKLSNIEALVETAVSQILSNLDSPKLGELSIALVNDDHIQRLNKDYRGKDKPTNVLSFPATNTFAGPAPLLGDIVLALETVTREAGEKPTTLEAHFSHLIIHGFLHLQGYEHETDEEAAEMETLEITALAALNIDNPYEIHER